MKKLVSILILFIACQIVLFAQEQPPGFDKPGTFTILNRTNYTLPECGFTKAEHVLRFVSITFDRHQGCHAIDPIDSARIVSYNVLNL